MSKPRIYIQVPSSVVETLIFNIIEKSSKMSHYVKWFIFLVFFNGLYFADSAQDLRKDIFEDALSVWQSFRDPDNGAWCDTLQLNQIPMVQCGVNNNFYSGAGTGNWYYFDH